MKKELIIVVTCNMICSNIKYIDNEDVALNTFNEKTSRS